MYIPIEKSKAHVKNLLDIIYFSDNSIHERFDYKNLEKMKFIQTI